MIPQKICSYLCMAVPACKDKRASVEFITFINIKLRDVINQSFHQIKATSACSLSKRCELIPASLHGEFGFEFKKKADPVGCTLSWADSKTTQIVWPNVFQVVFVLQSWAICVLKQESGISHGFNGSQCPIQGCHLFFIKFVKDKLLLF